MLISPYRFRILVEYINIGTFGRTIWNQGFQIRIGKSIWSFWADSFCNGFRIFESCFAEPIFTLNHLKSLFHGTLLKLCTYPFFCRASLGYKNAGLMATYHAKNEYCLLSDMCQGYGVFVSVISQLEEWIEIIYMKQACHILLHNKNYLCSLMNN